MQFKFENGQESPPVNILPTSGKYMLPEVKVIKDIITSIEPVELVKESVGINRLAGFPLMIILADNSDRYMVNINTAYGVVSFMATLNPGEEIKIPKIDDDEPMTEYVDDVDAPVTDKELDILKKYAESNLQ